MSTRCILSPPPSPSKVHISGNESSDCLGNDQKLLKKLDRLVQRIRDVATSPKLQLPRVISSMASQARELKLNLTVNENIRPLFQKSESLNIIITLLKKCTPWSGILMDLIFCVRMATALPNGVNEQDGSDRHHEMIFLMCRCNVLEIILSALKKNISISENARSAGLEIMKQICDFVSMQNVASIAPRGRDVVFDAAAMIQSTVHALVKSGALSLLPQILIECYINFEGTGSDCIIAMLVFILRNCSGNNASDVSESIDKGFVSASVVAVYRCHYNELDEDGRLPRSPKHANLLILLAGLTTHSPKIALALAMDRRKWSVISKIIEDNYHIFEGNSIYESWYRACFGTVSRAMESLPADENASCGTRLSKNSRFSRGSSDKYSSGSIGSNRKSPVLMYSRSNVDSFDEKGSDRSQPSVGRRSYIEEKDTRTVSSVQYALDRIARGNDPSHIEVDEAAESPVLYRLANGPYCRGKFQSAYEMPGASKGPKSPKKNNQYEVEITERPMSPEAAAIKTLLQSKERDLGPVSKPAVLPSDRYDFENAMDVIAVIAPASDTADHRACTDEDLNEKNAEFDVDKETKTEGSDSKPERESDLNEHIEAVEEKEATSEIELISEPDVTNESSENFEVEIYSVVPPAPIPVQSPASVVINELQEVLSDDITGTESFEAISPSTKPLEPVLVDEVVYEVTRNDKHVEKKSSSNEDIGGGGGCCAIM